MQIVVPGREWSRRMVWQSPQVRRYVPDRIGFDIVIVGGVTVSSTGIVA